MKLRTLLMAAVLAVPGAALAQQTPAKPQSKALSYDYLQATYDIWTDPDVNQWKLRGSYRVHGNVYLMVEDSESVGPLGGRMGGAGFAWPLQPNLHVYGEFALADHVDGFRPVLEGGARMAIIPEVEVRGALRYITDGGFDDRTGVEDEILFIAEGLYHLDRKVSLIGGLAVPVETDGIVLNFGARYGF